MTILGIAHVQLAMPKGQEAAARSFYGELLGLEELPKPETLAGRGGAWFRCGQQELHLGVEDDVAASRRHPALLSDDLDGLRRRLEGAAVPTQDDRPIPGYRRFYARDPFGNRLEFLQPL